MPYVRCLRRKEREWNRPRRQRGVQGIGSAGGHAAMAGGFVENTVLEKMGTGYHGEIKRLFSDYIEKLGL